MKLTELIEKAQEALDRHGDLPVIVLDPSAHYLKDDESLIIIGDLIEKYKFSREYIKTPTSQLNGTYTELIQIMKAIFAKCHFKEKINVHNNQYTGKIKCFNISDCPTPYC